jgi:hypothetical protein
LWNKRLYHYGKADARNCNYGHSKMADVESGKNVFCRLNCFYNVFMNFPQEITNYDWKMYIKEKIRF